MGGASASSERSPEEGWRTSSGIRWLTRTSQGWLALGLAAYLADAVLGALDPTSDALPGGRGGQWAGVVVRGTIIVIMASRLHRRRSRRRIGRYLLVLGALEAGITLRALTQDFRGWSLLSLMLSSVLVACANLALSKTHDEPSDEAVEAAAVADNTRRFAELQKQAFAELGRRNDAALANRPSPPSGTDGP